MSDIMVIAGFVIALGATLVLLIFGIKQWQMRQSIKDVPMRYNEWLANYKAKRGYILIAQLIGIVICILGLAI